MTHPYTAYKTLTSELKIHTDPFHWDGRTLAMQMEVKTKKSQGLHI